MPPRASTDVVPLSSDFSNTSAFVDGMFADGVRGPRVVWDAMKADPAATLAPIADPGSIALMLQLWLELWEGGTPPQAYLQTDADFLAAWAGYVQANAPVLWVPNLVFGGQWTGEANQSSPVYSITGYTSYPLGQSESGVWTWNAANVTLLLNYFLNGAHFVFIQDPTAPGKVTVPDFIDYLRADSSVGPLLRSGDFDSHYTSTIADTGNAYPNTIDSNETPPDCPLICAGLVGPTVQPSLFHSDPPRDVFLQLEGWPQIGLSTGGRHHADYEAFGDTYWNYSTYGASAYSEKRGTALFLAPAGWRAATNPATIMPPYAGADPLQPWLNTALVET